MTPPSAVARATKAALRLRSASFACIRTTTFVADSLRREMSSNSDASFMQDRSLLYRTSKESEYELGKHRSNALELVMKQPVIEVEGDTAICDGGGGALGHPIEYIKVANLNGEPQPCAYCGLRYSQKEH